MLILIIVFLLFMLLSFTTKGDTIVTVRDANKPVVPAYDHLYHMKRVKQHNQEIIIKEGGKWSK